MLKGIELQQNQKTGTSSEKEHRGESTPEDYSEAEVEALLIFTGASASAWGSFGYALEVVGVLSVLRLGALRCLRHRMTPCR
jgi:hypothetical protein